MVLKRSVKGVGKSGLVITEKKLLMTHALIVVRYLCKRIIGRANNNRYYTIKAMEDRPKWSCYAL
jgi:hypothetical protein